MNAHLLAAAYACRTVNIYSADRQHDVRQPGQAEEPAEREGEREKRRGRFGSRTPGRV